VQHEIDLRGREGRDPSDGEVATESPLGSDVRFTIADKAASYSLTPVATWQLYLRCEDRRRNAPGAGIFSLHRRVQTVPALSRVCWEGLLGMSQSDIEQGLRADLTFCSGSGRRRAPPADGREERSK